MITDKERKIENLSVIMNMITDTSIKLWITSVILKCNYEYQLKIPKYIRNSEKGLRISEKKLEI